MNALTKVITFVVLFNAIVFVADFPEAQAAGYSRATVFSQRKVPLYKDPDANSQVLGRYGSGTSIQVFTAPRNGFYAIYFAQPFQGVHYVWIPVNEVQLEGGGGGGGSGGERGRDTIRLGPNAFQFGPSTIQTALGDPSSSFFTIGYNLEYERKFNDNWGGIVQLGHYSFTKAVVTANDPLVTYFTSAFTMMVGPVYHVLRGSKSFLSLSAGLGIAINSAGNSSDGAVAGNISVNTTFILTYPLFVALTGGYNFSSDWGMYVKLGYQHLSLSAVPIVVLPAGLTYTTADFNMDSLFAGAGIAYHF